jgi:5-(carboxyamino)imidazole ribonucleotide mutase
MPAGVPVATVALNGSKNAGILAAQILASHDQNIAEKLEILKTDLKTKVEEAASEMEKDFNKKR